MSSMDKKIKDNNEQGKEKAGEKPKKGYSVSKGSSSDQIDRINQQLSQPNLTPSARKALEEKKKQLGG